MRRLENHVSYVSSWERFSIHNICNDLPNQSAAPLSSYDLHQTRRQSRSMAYCDLLIVDIFRIPFVGKCSDPDTLPLIIQRRATYVALLQHCWRHDMFDKLVWGTTYDGLLSVISVAASSDENSRSADSRVTSSVHELMERAGQRFKLRVLLWSWSPQRTISCLWLLVVACGCFACGCLWLFVVACGGAAIMYTLIDVTPWRGARRSQGKYEERFLLFLLLKTGKPSA